MNECTTIDKPFCMYDADQHVDHDSCRQTPAARWTRKTSARKSETPSSTSNGVLTPNDLIMMHQWISVCYDVSLSREKAQIMKKTGMRRVLLLGSGYVSGPVVEYLTRDKTTQVTVASMMLRQAEELAEKYPNTIPVMLDAGTKHCIRRKVNMVTASYLSPAMKELQSSAEEAGITIVNEMGLDPGIDHMLAMECIDKAKADGCTVESYSSFCGGLPAPECSDNPLRYKFSWSPYGVLLNTISPAIFLQDNQVVEIPAGGSLMESSTSKDFFPGFNLEGFPNRDSTIYAESYGIQSAHTLIRGTLRFKGFTKAMTGFVKLGLINSEPCPKELLCKQMGLSSSVSDEAFEEAVYERIGKDDFAMETLRWFGMLSEESVLHADSGERDMIIMRNDVGLRHPTGELETKHISLVVYGTPNGFSAMAKTVGYPAAIAARMEIYEPALARLKEEGLYFMSKSDLQE
ncbi:hypothetical protein F7725_023341 [Dissostichus mawsoni]|uniref:Saccharopine dehydrogenase-like C-terminal domain-containing protein n=1 Tax=Dissostichus mawsoni TaxID=36200 RepID=A0A7J5Z0X1_DISMA|nr:hypothetical protein F7725_023341 [Dissostichus mawsoni]